MRRSYRKVNFLIEKTICNDLERLVPPSERIQVVNDALRKELELIRRRNAVEKLIEASSTMEKLSTREIVEGLRQDRVGC
jgi:hypothetical protein